MSRDAGNNGAGGLRERMEQVALLPRHDPVRTKLLEEIAVSEGMGAQQTPTGREWTGIVAEADRLKNALAAVRVPAGLEQRLLELPLPPVLPFWRRPMNEIFSLRRLAIAAALILLVSAGWAGYLALSAAQEAKEIRQVAAEAADVHATVLRSAPAEHLETSDPTVATQWLQSRVKFRAMVLAGGAAKLTGASVVHLRGAMAALTLWEDAGHRYSLLEFVPEDLGLRADFPASPDCSASSGTPATTYRVLLWSQTQPNYRCGWALVMDPSAPVPFKADGCP